MGPINSKRWRCPRLALQINCHTDHLTLQSQTHQPLQNMTPQNHTPIQNPDVWTMSDFKDHENWISIMTPDETHEIIDIIETWRRHPCPVADINLATVICPHLAMRFDAIKEEIEGGRGFYLLRGLPIEKFSAQEAQVLAWILSHYLGEPQSQDKLGSLIHSVTNTGLKVAENSDVRSYQTDDELTFHNDGGDAFMLLCYKTAKTGGMSKLVSVSAVFNEILKRKPELIETLQETYYFDTRQQHPLGLKIQTCPILNFHQGYLSVLYKRRYLLAAQRFEEVPKLTDKQIEALDLFEKICNEPDIQLSFYMQPGDIQIANNFSVLHSRTKYEDHVEPEEKRHLFRIWLTLKNGRPLPPAFEGTREFRTSYLSRSLA